MSVQCRLSEARIVVRDHDLEFKGVAGDISFSPGVLEGRDLAGSLGKSSFSGMTARLDLRKALYVQHLSGDLALSLGEIHRRLASREAFREATKEIKAVRGTLALGVKSLSGPLEKPDKWRFEAGGAVKGLVVETSLLPGPVKVPRGSFRGKPEKHPPRGCTRQSPGRGMYRGRPARRLSSKACREWSGR